MNYQDYINMEKFTIIIPTMWKINEYFLPMLKLYEEESLIDEILIIDNNPKLTPKLNHLKKIKRLCNGVNNFINPSWNWGVITSNNDYLIIANDDIKISNKKIFHSALNFFLQELPKGHITIWNKHSEKNPEIKLSQIEHLNYGNGILFFTNKFNYVDIPEEMKLFYGDNFIFHNSDINYEINLGIETPMSKTIKSEKEIDKLSIKEFKEFKELFE